jgi:hypothetical protein
MISKVERISNGTIDSVLFHVKIKPAAGFFDRTQIKKELVISSLNDVKQKLLY